MRNGPLSRSTKMWAAIAAAGLLRTTAFADAGDPAARVARLSYVQGSVSLQPAGEDDWSRASRNYTMTTGDRLYTDVNSRAEMEMGPFAVRLAQTTDASLTKLDDHLLQLAVTRGSVCVTLFELPDDGSVEVDTPNGALTLLRAGSYRVDCDAGAGSTVATVNSGSIEVSAGSVARAVQGGEAVQLTGTDPVEVTFVARGAQDVLDQWCSERDKRVRSSAAKRYVHQYVPGIEDLDTYGGWESSPDYGSVWYPSGAAVGWAPYREGHWAWVEPWGWTWVGHEPWGFGPYHYGRWVRNSSRWGWVPGPRTTSPFYAPALVAFVGNGGVGVQAWFPLGPREPYYPSYHHGDGYLRNVNAANVRDPRGLGDLRMPAGPDRLRYVNRGAGTTAVSAEVFRSGQAVSKKALADGARQTAANAVVYRPAVDPSEAAAFRGSPPLRPAVFTGSPPGPRSAPYRSGPARAPAQGQSAPGMWAPTAPGVRVPAGPAGGAPPTGVRSQQGTGSGTPRAVTGPSPRVFTRNQPPPSDPPYVVRSPVLKAQPGRPLEPQQRRNLQDGKPAGPPKDQDAAPRRTPSGYAPPSSPPKRQPVAPRPSARPSAPARTPPPTRPAPKDRGEPPPKR